MAKRRLISLLPGFNQTDDLANFFGSTVDEVFQPGMSEALSGYIGRKPSFFDPATDFYVGEPTTSRAHYQLEAGMISVDDTDTITNTLTYPDFIGYLMTSGANVTDHQRLFETEYYSWAPPINIDMLTNYREYYWFGDETGSADLPTLIVTVPMATYTGDGIQDTFALPSSIIAVDPIDEMPGVYVDNVPVAFSVSGDDVICSTPPANGTTVLVARTPDLATAISGMVSVDISDMNAENVQFLTSTMRIKIVDAIHIVGAWDAQPWDSNLWDLSGTDIYMVDGIGQSLRLTPDNYLIRGLEAQYITIDRSSLDFNLWSLHNSWVHKDSYAWSGLDFHDRQAVRPIIEFIRDIVLYPGQIWSESTDPLFMLYDIDNVALNDASLYPGSNFTGSRIFGYKAGTAPIDPVLHRQLTFDANGYPVFENDAFAIQYTSDNGSITSLYCYATDAAAYLSGSISGTTLTADIVLRGIVAVDQILSGTGIPANTTIDAFGTGTGGAGTYTISTPLTIASENMQLDQLSYSSLWHLAANVTSQGFTDGFFDVPINLEANPTSDDVTLISRSTWINHFEAIIGNQNNLSGHALGDNNYRDTARDLSLGNSILQHRAPLLKAMLTASDTEFDVPQALRFADQEYNRFRNKFARRLIDINNKGTLSGVDPTVDPDTWVITTLTQLKRDKTNSFPFALSTMAGGQYFIPPTPASLGVLPACVPSMLMDNTYTTSVLMIQGHDGSLTPAFGDWRDNVFLALEQMIYTNLPSQFQTEARPVFDIAQWIGGRFFAPENGYNRNEVSGILAPMFEIWAQLNRFDYRTNTSYDPGDPFTWNYSGVADRFGNILPGNWRAIYRFYYGTDAPHLRPWEMLGFSGEPTWWVGTYGTAPYLRSNTTLWTDLENGTIAGGPRMGTDDDYSRPGLADLIPVDNAGNLLDPVQTGIVNINLPLPVASRSWQVGDQGPAENLWINSPSYRFALALGAFLMKPAQFMEECWDSINIGYVGPQWVEIPTLSRPINSDQYVHGEIKPDGSTAVVVGVQQWISDYIVSTGQKPSDFGAAIRGLGVQLIHQMAGFVSNDEIKAIADNFGLLPNEDVQVVLYTSPSTDVEVYSGVILEWTGRSWRAIGYDARDPKFTIIPPDTSGPKGIISLATAEEPSIVKWRPNTYFPINILAEYQNSVYQCTRSHTSSSRFENDFWKARPDLATSMIRAPRVITYLRGLTTTQDVPYGTEFYTYQDIADFLLGWERYLVSRGWIFDGTDVNSGEILNWSLSVKEFLTWAQIQWQPGNFVALSPGQQGLKFSIDNGTILNVEDNITGFFGLINRSGQPIRQRDAIINRLDGQIMLQANNNDIFSARLEIAEVEHALVFSNVTIFEDNVYLPLFDMRQIRLRLICNRSTDWAGRLDAPGYVIIGNQLKSNFEKSANDVRLMFDIELADVKDLREYARHNIGFQERDYLNSLLLSDTEQFEFYQGMIQQKGAPGVFERLMRSQRASSNSNLQFLEEWAFRISRFGAPVDPLVTFKVLQTDNRADPQIIRFTVTPGAPLTWIIMPMSDDRWVDKPNNVEFFTLRPDFGPTQPPSMPSAGPVRLSDVDNTVFHIADLETVYDSDFTAELIPFITDTLTWVYERDDQTFTVLQSFETGSVPNAILKVETKAEDIAITTSRIFFQNTFNLTTGDIGNYLVIDGQSKSSPDLQGVQKITAVNVGLNYVDVETVGTQGFDFTSTPSDAPFVRILREVRFATTSDLNAAAYDWTDGDLAWVDNSGDWYVAQRSGSSWIQVRNQPHKVDPTTISETVIYRENVRIQNQQMFVHEPVVDVLDVIDPMSGILAGICDREIAYKTSFDPARYTSGAANAAVNAWGENQLGQVWFNLSTVKFLEPYTDTIGATDQRDVDELKNRAFCWGKIAPNSSVDVYEWIKSTVSPIDYAANPTTYPGTVLNADGPSWVERLENGKVVYFFWVKGLTVVPNVDFRHIDIATITNGITNPSSLDIPWLAPISGDALVVSGVVQFLNDEDTLLKVRLTLEEDNPGRHDEWILMRKTDATSLPTAYMWSRIQVGLATFNQDLNPVPSPALSDFRNTGININQNIFEIDSPAGARMGLMDARETFVESLNNIFANVAVARDRQTYIDTIRRSTTIDPNLIWTQIDRSYPYEAPPRNEWDVEVFTLDHRNQLVGRSDFIDAITNGYTIRVLLNSVGNPLGTQGWSIWNFNPVSAATIIAANPSLNASVALLQNADSVFDLALSYEHSVVDRAARDALIYPVPTISLGDRVIINPDAAADNFWTIWKYVSNTGDPNVDWLLWRTQTYRTDDFFSYVDWYDSGYFASNPPIITYATTLDRNNTEGNNPTNLFVKVEDDGTPAHNWIWTVFAAGEWITVAIQNGTIALSSNFYDPTKTFNTFAFGSSVTHHSTAGLSTGATTLVDSTLGISVGMNAIGDGLALGSNVLSFVPDTAVTFDKNFVGLVSVGEAITFYTDSPSITTISTRDGSWELYILVQALRYAGLLLDSEINQVWFDIVNFCHVQQADVDWAFKTSFMTIVGYNVPLEETPFVVPDQTNNLISYVDEVKPYHVKVREFSTQYNTDPDLAHATVTDFDKPVYLDPNTNQYRVLDPIADAAILQTLPWYYWYNNYLNSDTQVRGLDITLVFDRYVADINNWDIEPWDIDTWDNTEDGASYIYVHTYVAETLTADGLVMEVDDVRFLIGHAPFSIMINGNTYNITGVIVDDINISTTLHASSGTLIADGNIIVVDGTLGNLIEAKILMPSAAERIRDDYAPTAGMPPNDLELLLDLDMKGGTVVYPTTTDVGVGTLILTFASTAGISEGWPISGPNIVKGTYVVTITATTATLSAPTVGVIPSGTNVTFNLPNWIDGYILQTFEAPISEFDMFGFDSDEFDIVTDIEDTTYTGDTLSPDPTLDISINPAQTSRPGGFDLRAPYYAPNHPQERVPFAADDGIQIIVTANADAGGPPQKIKTFDVLAMPGPTAVLFSDMLSQYSDGLMVFRDGVRGTAGIDYIVDWLARTVEVVITGTARVSIHVFGFGATSAIDEQHFIVSTGNGQTFTLDQSPTLSQIEVLSQGTALTPTTDYTIAGNIVTIGTNPYGGPDLGIIVYDGTTADATTMVTEVLGGSGPWALGTPAQTAPEHGGTIVEVNGERLAPQTTWYGKFTLEKEWMFLPIAPDIFTSVTVYVDGVLYGDPIPFASGTDPLSTYPLNLVVPSPPSTFISGQFVFFDNVMVALDPLFASDNVSVVLDFGTPPDYEVTGGTLTINTALGGGDIPVATTFTNDITMGLQTVVYPTSWSPSGDYFIPIPFGKDYALVAMNGLELSPDFEYEITEEEIGWDSMPWDSNIWDLGEPVGVLHIFTPTSGNIVATVATAPAAREHMEWRVATNTPAFVRMPPALDADQNQIMGFSMHSIPATSPTFTADAFAGDFVLTFAFGDTVDVKNGQFVVFDDPDAGQIATRVVSHTATTVTLDKALLEDVHSGDKASFFAPVPQYDGRYEYLRMTPYMAAVLNQELAPDDTQIFATLFAKELSPKLQDQNPLPQPNGNIPGVVWINNERIEYFGYSRSGDDVTLTGLRRATQGTTITEQRVVTVDTGTGSSQVLILDGSNGTGPVEVTVDGVIYTNFTSALVTGDIHVTLTVDVGAYITTAMTVGYTYPVGEEVYNGKETFRTAVPIGPDVGNRELDPMHRIIAG